ncbi:MAG: hypothetical protein J7599_07445 [Niabella sp.]|nr:hypothetical protein [Niabella sp.]
MISKFLIKNWYWFAAIILAGAICFFIGRANTVTITKTEYVTGKTITDSIPGSDPVKSTIPVNPKLPTKPDTVWMKGKPYPVPGRDSIVYQPYDVVQKVDTGKIIQEYITQNEYSNTLFDDNNGKLTVASKVQYNKLQRLDYAFTPVQKVVTKERKRTFTPFLTGSYNTFNQAAAGGGIYIKNIGIGAKYVKDLTTGKTGYEGGIYIKF